MIHSLSGLVNIMHLHSVHCLKKLLNAAVQCLAGAVAKYPNDVSSTQKYLIS